MLPESLNSAFQRYKRDTNAIATWLAITADNNGHPVYTNANKTSGRKGKARKQHKPSSINEDTSSSNNTRTYLVPLKAFVPLATFIASVKPKIPVPLFLAYTIDRVIDVRTTVAQVMGTKEDGATDESVVTHLHFVDVLKQIRDIFRQQMETATLDISRSPIAATNASTTGSAEGTQGPKYASLNPFNILDVYETAEQVCGSEGTTPPADLIIEYEPEPQDTYHEACLAFMSLLKAFLHQRQKVREIWHNYKVGRVFLAPAAIGTNEAIEICRQMEEDVAAVISKGSNVVDLLVSVFKIMCQLEGQDVKIPGQGRRNTTNWDTYEIANLTMSHVGRILSNVVSENRKGGLDIYNGSQGWYDKTMDRASSTNRQKYAKDNKALVEVISDIRVFGIISDKKTTEDEFTRGVHKLLNTNEVALWQCIAAQIYLDVLYELEATPNLAWSEMAGTAHVIRTSLVPALADPGDVHLVENWREIEQSLYELAGASSEWDNDPIALYKSQRGIPAKPNQFLRRHPLYCGVWVHEMRARFHEAGVCFASAFGYVHQMYQLYHALRQEKLLGPLSFWRDMVSLFQMQEQATFFVGDVPNTAQEYLDNLRLKSGLAVLDRPQGKNKGKNKRLSVPNGEQGKLRELGTMSMIFKKRFRKTSSRRDITTEYVQKIIESNGFRFVKRNHGNWDLQRAEATSDSDRTPTPVIPATQLVVCVTMAMRAEAHEVAFNYFLLHMDCFRILEDIRKMIGDSTVQRLAPDAPKQKCLPSVVAMVFRDAAGQEPEGLMQHAASIMRNHFLKPSSMASTMGMRDLGFDPCSVPYSHAQMDGLPQLLQLPDELLSVVTWHIPTAAETAAFGSTCRRLRKIVCTSPVWREHCLTTWNYWEPRHELPAKLALPPLQTDWRQLYLQRVSSDLEAVHVFQDMISSERSRMSRMDEIAQKGHDVQDLLLNLKDRTPEHAEDVLARRWYADAILKMIHRSRAVDVWRRFQTARDITTEEALCAFDTFVLTDSLGDFAAVERHFDRIAKSIRDSTANFEDKTPREKALLIAGYLWSEGLVGMSARPPDVTNYHALRNNFITMALFSTHTSLPLQSVVIYCAVARRCGVIATPSNFPRHVHAVVQAPPDQTMDGAPKTSGTDPEFMHIDVWQEPHQLNEDLLRLRLLQNHIPVDEHDRQLGPSDGVNTLVRAARNVLVSVNNARLHQEGGDTPSDEPSYDPDPTSAQYASFWAMCLLLDEGGGSMQRREFVQVLLQIFLKQFPEDFALFEEWALPMLEGSLDYGRAEELIEELVATDAEPIEPKIRAALIGEIQFRVGQHFEHRRYGYKGFIVGWDGRCEADTEWIEMMQVDNLRRGRLQPFYNIVAEDKSQRYVAEENIVIDRERPSEKLLQLAGRYFKRWDDRECKFVSIIQEQYPDD
ncbi:hypothetical protein KVR01_000654 [Diaporthe batatas]|uniref:uncharacterized protein n=1 Tax=Diaporthe batatas TaxID=748121 RepID=UPI001D05310E|nr:uncharacterized protein KVR01_000654 [Diaporthe batatas]KAG8169909.1 hypothetical protein KVR01_000654 [Diaporthe batatas]